MEQRRRGPVGLFFDQFRRNFVQTGAVLPSGRALARAITAHIAPAGAPRRILEAGPGTGVFTAEIARRMGPFDHLDIYEINPAFADLVEERLLADPVFRPLEGRVFLHRRDALEIPEDAIYDRIVSGLPLNNFDPELVRALFETFMARLGAGGILSWFEYALIRGLKQVVAGSAERERLRRVGEITDGYIRHYQVRSETVLLNVPPAIARHLVKPACNHHPAPAPAALRPAAAVR